MKKSSFILVFLLLISVQIASAEQFPNPQDKYINDFAGIFTSEEVAYLRNLLQGVEQNMTAEIVIVTIETVSPYTAQEYATNLASQWKVGKIDKDNGLMILYALKENKIWVATGYGLEGILPDSKIGRLLDEYYVPLRDENKTKQGIIAFTEKISEILKKEGAEAISDMNLNFENNPLVDSGLIFFLLIFLLISIFTWIKRFKEDKNKKNKKVTWKSAWFWIAQIVLIIVIFITTNFIIMILALIAFMALSRFNPAGRARGTGHAYWIGSGFGSGGGGFSGGGFGGGGFGGGGAGR